MTDRTCIVEGCDRSAHARGWCGTHYRRWWKTGDVREDFPVGALEHPIVRFMRKVRWSTERHYNGTPCLEWTAHLNVHGYGHFGAVDGAVVRAHRWFWIQLVGPIPEGLELDHLCSNRACVNPMHLEAVTHAENVRRGERWQLRKTHCPQGHEYTEENTYRQPSKPGRTCRACRAADSARRNAAKR